jgi:uncharacterized protein YecE (DUF72 family)
VVAGEQVTVEPLLVELHQRKSALKVERAVAINHEERQHPTFTKASQNVAVVTVLLYTFPAPSTDRVDKVYQQLKNILGTTIMLQAESSLQHWAETFVSTLGHSKDRG